MCNLCSKRKKKLSKDKKKNIAVHEYVETLRFKIPILGQFYYPFLDSKVTRFLNQKALQTWGSMWKLTWVPLILSLCVPTRSSREKKRGRKFLRKTFLEILVLELSIFSSPINRFSVFIQFILIFPILFSSKLKLNVYLPKDLNFPLRIFLTRCFLKVFQVVELLMASLYNKLRKAYQ